VVEDILDTGRTLTVVLDAMQKGGRRASRSARCVAEARGAALNLPVCYVGFDIPPEFVVGWGLDYAERYRNLRGVHRLILDGDG